jgi:phospholipid/cholesterol/gamma-HCH transport system ATP-binding protein
LRENLVLSDALMNEIATAKLEMVGLKPDDGDKFPSELSGGMTKRVALARALALDPAIVFLDEPTSGLDPIAAGDFDVLIKTLQETLGLTVFMVTHDLASLNTVCDLVAALADGKIVAIGPMRELVNPSIPCTGLFSWQAFPDAPTKSELRENPRSLRRCRCLRSGGHCCGLRLRLLAA